jgi:hypothetical protein
MKLSHTPSGLPPAGNYFLLYLCRISAIVKLQILFGSRSVEDPDLLKIRIYSDTNLFQIFGSIPHPDQHFNVENQIDINVTRSAN